MEFGGIFQACEQSEEIHTQGKFRQNLVKFTLKLLYTNNLTSVIFHHVLVVAIRRRQIHWIISLLIF